MKLDFNLTQKERIEFVRNFKNPTNEQKEILANYILWAEPQKNFYITEEKILKKQKQYGVIYLEEHNMDIFKKISSKATRIRNKPIDYEKEATKPIKELLKTIIHLENSELDRDKRKLLSDLYKEKYYILDNQRNTINSRYDVQAKNFHDIIISEVDEFGLEVYPSMYTPAFKTFDILIGEKTDKMIDLTNIAHLSELYKNWHEYPMLHETLEFFEGLLYLSKKKQLVLKTRKTGMPQISAAKYIERELGSSINPNYLSTILYKQILPAFVEKVQDFINSQGDELFQCAECGKNLPDNSKFYHYSNGKRKRKKCKKCYLGG